MQQGQCRFTADPAGDHRLGGAAPGAERLAQIGNGFRGDRALGKDVPGHTGGIAAIEAGRAHGLAAGRIARDVKGFSHPRHQQFIGGRVAQGHFRKLAVDFVLPALPQFSLQPQQDAVRLVVNAAAARAALDIASADKQQRWLIPLKSVAVANQRALLRGQ